MPLKFRSRPTPCGSKLRITTSNCSVHAASLVSSPFEGSGSIYFEKADSALLLMGLSSRLHDKREKRTRTLVPHQDERQQQVSLLESKKTAQPLRDHLLRYKPKED